MHGGDIYRNRIKMDFSVNTNVQGIPSKVMEAMIEGVCNAEKYPDIRCEELKKKIGEHFGVDSSTVVCGNGASELMMAICRWRKAGRALLTAPGFSGYEKMLKVVGSEICFHELEEKKGFVPDESLMDKVKSLRPGIVFFANPSNPTGVLKEKEYVEKLIQTCNDVHTTIIVDECFMELTDKGKECSVTGLLGKYKNLFVLRAFTKSFSIPGVRLGYLLCGDSLKADKIARELPEWNVSIPAQKAGIVAMDMENFLKKSVEIIEKNRKKLVNGLEELGAVVYNSSANFVLFKWHNCHLYDDLLKSEILIRDCGDYPGLGKGYYRVAVKTEEENRQLLKAMEQTLEKRN